MLEYKYICQYCKYKTDSSSNYKRHLKTIKHQENTLLYESKPIIQKSLDTKNLDIINYSKTNKNNYQIPIQNMKYNQIDDVKSTLKNNLIKINDSKNIVYFKNKNLIYQIKNINHKKIDNFNNLPSLLNVNEVTNSIIDYSKEKYINDEKLNLMNINGLKLNQNKINLDYINKNKDIFSLTTKLYNYKNNDNQIITYSNNLIIGKKKQLFIYSNVKRYNDFKKISLLDNNWNTENNHKFQKYKLNFNFSTTNNKNNLKNSMILSSNNQYLEINLNQIKDIIKNQIKFNFLGKHIFNDNYLNINNLILKPDNCVSKHPKNSKINNANSNEVKPSFLKEYNYEGFELIS